MRVLACLLVCVMLGYGENVYVDLPADNPARPAVDSLNEVSRLKDSVINIQCVRLVTKLKGQIKCKLRLDTASYKTCGEYFLFAMNNKKLDTTSVIGYYLLYKELLQNDENLYTTMRGALDEYDNARLYLTARVREIREKLVCAQTTIFKLSAVDMPTVER